jgi:DNA anti-recombination protein RmuC
MEDEARRMVPAGLQATWERATGDPDPLAALDASRTLAREVGRWQGALVAEAVRSGATWEQIGDTLGISRQAAWARFRRAIDDEGGRPMENDRNELKRRIQAEARSLREAMRSLDESHRQAQTEAANKMREMQREARRERQELRDRMKENIRALQEELRARKDPA